MTKSRFEEDRSLEDGDDMDFLEEYHPAYFAFRRDYGHLDLEDKLYRSESSPFYYYAVGTPIINFASERFFSPKKRGPLSYSELKAAFADPNSVFIFEDEITATTYASETVNQRAIATIEKRGKSGTMWFENLQDRPILTLIIPATDKLHSMHTVPKSGKTFDLPTGWPILISLPQQIQYYLSDTPIFNNEKIKIVAATLGEKTLSKESFTQPAEEKTVESKPSCSY